MTSVRFLPEAKEDFTQAARFYESRELGLGDRFLDELESCLERIKEQPLLGSAVSGNLRRRLLRRFPFFVVYAQEGSQVIIVVAVAHTSRKPGYWSSRE